MKKTLYLLVVFFMFSLFIGSVYAGSFTVRLEGNTTFTNEVNVDIVLGNIDELTYGFFGLDATLNYDKDKLELKNIAVNNMFQVTYDMNVSNRFVILTGNIADTGAVLGTLQFQAKNLAENENVTIGLTNLIGSDGDNDYPGFDVSKILTHTTSSYQKGDMNKNGKIDLNDVIILLRKYLNGDATSEDIQLGDMNNDTHITLSDVIALLRLYLTN